MLRALLLALASLTLTLSHATDARAGWVQSPAAYYVKLWDRTLVGSKVFDLDGGHGELGQTYQDHAFNVYVEYGATEELTVVFHAAPIAFAKLGEESTVYSGVTALGVRYGLVRGEVPIALQLSYGYSPPLGEMPLAEGTVGGVAYTYRPSFEQHLGSAELSLGYAFGPAWAKAAGGATISSAEGIDPALEASLAIGATWSFGLAASVQATYHTPSRAPRIIDITGTGNTRYLGLNLSLSWWFLEHVAANAGIGTAAFAESNAATPSITFGVEIRS